MPIAYRQYQPQTIYYVIFMQETWFKFREIDALSGK